MRFLIGLWLLLATAAFGQSPADGKILDSLAHQAQRYFNQQEPDLLYALTGTTFQQALPAIQFKAVTQMLYSQLGSWQSIERRSLEGGVARYKATFERQRLDFFLSRDKEGKIETFLFRPYEESIGRKAAPIATSNPLRTELDRRIDAVVREYIQRDNTVGVCVGLLRNDSLWVYGYGETARGNGQLPDGNTLFEIGSITKTFTAALLAEAARTGRLKLSDPVNRYLPDSLPPLEKNGKAVSLQTLANHSSGLPRLPTNLAGPFVNLTNPYRAYDTKALYAYLKTATLAQTPGSTYEYSNLGAGLLGTVLEYDYGKPYENLLREQLTGPLGLKSTVITPDEAQQRRFAQGHNDRKERASTWEFQALAGAGAIRSTVNDLLTYLQAQWKAPVPGLGEAFRLTRKPTFTNGQTSVGLGWHFRTGAAEPWYWHSGGTGGFVSFAGFNPTKRTAVVVLSNAQVSVDALADELTKVFK